MPTYQYACTECGHQLEAVQSFSDAPLTECPACQGRLRKRFNSVGIVFKGSGFYRTDSRSGANGSASEAKSDAPATNGTETKAAPAKSTEGSSSGNGSAGSSAGSTATSSSATSKAATGSATGS